ncbi:DUF3820 family protein [Mucilaginibacter sp. RS28]|uniref:DUF3820 family protein n=1 Tax=Mucilaginibacter straminoryzae TaxID=2932774 RepID=A0A9X1X4Q4_9SPHI|nr:DUF3820 family protein [Mucilaginibacter straminoryzae]MCJ8211147.1 DUF3820 family protein [Mucilaginibacter straminoryzae]
METVKPDYNVLIDVVQTRMPFGKYKGTFVADLPIHYLEWLYRKGMPPGKLGMLLNTAYEIKLNGMSALLFELKKVLAAKNQ